MSIQDSLYRSAQPGNGKGQADESEKKTIYRVVLEGVKSEIETIDSFAIKYGILTNTPVTRIKFLLRSLPVTILESQSASRARGALGLIEEAGGAGLIEDFDPVKTPKVEIKEEKLSETSVMEQTCSKCGFPLKKGDEFCDFCNTPLVETKPHKITTVMKAGGGGGLISPKRLAIYAVVVLLILILDLLLK